MMTPVMPALGPAGPATRHAGRGRGEDFAAALAAEEAMTAQTPKPAGPAKGGGSSPAATAAESTGVPEPAEDAGPGTQAAVTATIGEQPGQEGVRSADLRTSAPPAQQTQGAQDQQVPVGRQVQGEAQGQAPALDRPVAGQPGHQTGEQQAPQSASAAQVGEGRQAQLGQVQQGQVQDGQAQPGQQHQQAQQPREGQVQPGQVQQVQGQQPPALQGEAGSPGQAPVQPTGPAQASAGAPVPPQAPGPRAHQVPVAGAEPVQVAAGASGAPVPVEQAVAQQASAQPASAGGVEAGAPAATAPSPPPVTAPTAAGAPASGAPALPQPPPLGTQLAASLARLQTAPDGHHVLNIRVDPQDLGPVRVSAHISADGVRIELFGMSEAARDALRGALADLRRELAATGLQADLDLGAEDEPSEQPAPSTPGQPAEPRPTPTVTDTPTTTSRTAPLGGGGLDLFA